MSCSLRAVWTAIGLFCAGALLWGGSAPVRAQNRTTLTVQFEENDPLRQRVEDRVSRLLTELNRAKYFGDPPALSGQAVTEAGRAALRAHWKRAPFRCPEPSLTRTLASGREGDYELRSIPLLVGPDTAEVTKRKGVLVIDDAGRIDGFSFASERADASDTGAITVRTEPADATVVSAIEGGTRTRAPARFRGVPADVYAFTIRRVRYRDVVDTTFVVRAGQTVEHTVRLAPNPGALRVRSVPAGAAVHVDGKRRREPEAAQALSAGAHRVSVTKPSFARWDSTVTVPPGDTVSLAPELQRSQTPLAVRSAPSEARVHVDGTSMGRTPLDTTVAAGRRHTVQVSKDGYVPSAALPLEAPADSALERRVVLTALDGRSKAEAVRLTDLEAERTEEKIVVQYALAGEAGETYDVALRAVGPGDSPIALPDSAIGGAVGEGLSPGRDKQITLPDALPDGATLRLTVDETGGRRWLYVVGSAVVAGGGALVALLMGGGDGGETAFPAPPGLPD